MSDDPTLNDDGTPREPLDPRIREQLRRQEQELSEANAKIRASDLRAIYAELGIPTTDVGKLFRDTYSGDATIDAVRTAAEGYGDAVLPKQVDPRADQLEALRRLNAAGDPSQSPEAQDILNTTLEKLAATQKPGGGGIEEFDRIMASPEVQALRTQPINFN